MTAAIPQSHGIDIAAIDQANWLHAQLSAQPEYIAKALQRQHEGTAKARDTKAANQELVAHVERYRGRIPNNAADETLKAYADDYAMDVRRGMAGAPGDDYWIDYAIGHRICTAAKIEPPRPATVDDAGELYGCIERMRCKYWWRRKIRVAFGRRVEQSARALAMVQKRRALYISGDGFERWKERQGANRKTLDDTIATCEQTGQELTLVDIAAAGVSNPRVRRAELMTRMNGIEECAQRRGHAALFVTWTVPPEYHATHASGETGEGQHVTPREAQHWLRKQWAKCRSKLARDGVTLYGLRVAEPHHDGTPHWHLLVFIEPEQLAHVERVMRYYAVYGDTREKRQRYGCDLTRIDPARGSATGYVAKYVAKSIDGCALDVPTSRDAYGRQQELDIDPGEAANRVRAWASQWGIRQFQFIGAPPVGPWRELRRLEPIAFNSEERINSHALQKTELLRAAADAGDWSGYVELMGGPCIRSKDRPARVRYVNDAAAGRYGEPAKKPFIESYGRVIWTRPHTWRIEYRPGVSPADSAAAKAARLGPVKITVREGDPNETQKPDSGRKAPSRESGAQPDDGNESDAGAAVRAFRHSGNDSEQDRGRRQWPIRI